jgi:hypothetical protein
MDMAQLAKKAEEHFEQLSLFIVMISQLIVKDGFFLIAVGVDQLALLNCLIIVQV